MSGRAESCDTLARAMAILARRPYSAARLRAKLVAEHRPGEHDDTATPAALDPAAPAAYAAADAAVARLVEIGLLDDRRYAESFARDRFERGGYGRHRIRRDLLAAGVNEADADAALAAVVDEQSERARAAAVLDGYRRRAAARRREDREASESRRSQEYRHLVGRGFPAAIVRDLLGVSL